MKNIETRSYSSDEEFLAIEKEIEQELQDIIKDPKRRITEQLDPYQRSIMKVGDCKEIYDPGFGKMVTVSHIAKFYGKDILRRLKKEQKESLHPEAKRGKNHVSPELYRKMKKIHEFKRPQKKSKETIPREPKSVVVNKSEPKLPTENLQRKMQPGDEYFLQNRRGMIRNDKYRELFKGPSTVYEWLWANIARHGWKDTDDYPIKAKYFDNGFLAYSASISEVGKKCGMSKATAGKYIKQFEKAGVLRIEYLKPKGKKRGQSVFILGEWETINGEPKETFYRNQIYLSE